MLKEFFTELEWADKIKRKIPFVVLIIGLMIFRPALHWTLLTISLFILGNALYYSWKNKEPVKWYNVVQSIIQIILYILLIRFLFQWLGVYGYIGLIVVILIIAAVLLYRQRKNFMKILRFFEKQLFGKSLDRNNWEKGEKPALPEFDWKKW